MPSALVGGEGRAPSPRSDQPPSSPCRTAFLRSRPRMLLPAQSLVCLAAFGLALPLAISLFPQVSEVSSPPLPKVALSWHRGPETGGGGIGSHTIWVLAAGLWTGCCGAG